MSDEKILHVVSVSGGKDSTALMLLAIEKFPRDQLRFITADTGNEHDEVYDYLDYLEKELSIEIVRLKSDFSRQIAGKRLFIARDVRIKRDKKGKKLRWTNKAKRRALSALHPTGNPFLDLCLWKGRFPSRKAQFCTIYLKTEPLIKYQHSLVDEGYTVVSWQGVRRDESPARANVLQIEYAGGDIWQYRPLADWTAEETFEMHDKYGIKPNPLYLQGMNRVGCMPCINCNKAGINEIGKRFPDHIERIAEWERLVTQVSKRGCRKDGKGATFFPNLDRDPIDKPDIYAMIQWSGTARGGRQDDWLKQEPALSCASSYGLCE